MACNGRQKPLSLQNEKTWQVTKFEGLNLRLQTLNFRFESLNLRFENSNLDFKFSNLKKLGSKVRFEKLGSKIFEPKKNQVSKKIEPKKKFRKLGSKVRFENCRKLGSTLKIFEPNLNFEPRFLNLGSDFRTQDSNFRTWKFRCEKNAIKTRP